MPRPALCSLLVAVAAQGCASLSTPPSAAGRGAPLSSGVEPAHFSQSVTPGMDFYRHANGAWLEKVEIPADKASYGTFVQLTDAARLNLKTIVDELVAAPSWPSGSEAQKMGDLYRSYMNEAELAGLGLSPLRDELARIDALKNPSELVGYFAQASALGVATPLALFVEIDFKEPSRYVSFLYQSGLGLGERERYLDAKPEAAALRQAYQNHIAQMFKLAAWKNPGASAASILQLETALAKVQWSRVALRDHEKTYNPHDRVALNKLAPRFPWDVYLSKSGTGDEKLWVVSAPSYLRELTKLIQTRSMSEWRTYLRWQLLRSYADYLAAPMAEEHFAFYGTRLHGVAKREERWKRAVDLVGDVLGEALGKEYVKRHFRPEAKAAVEGLVENLRAAYRQSIDELDWMGESSKQQAIAKLAAFRKKIGYPSKWRDYEGLTIRAGELVGNLRRAAEFERAYNLGKLGKPIDRDEWHISPQTVNAYYHPTMNEVVFPAAILQAPFFNPAADDAVNYGAIGAVIGHEMGHGFDDQGAKFDGDGRMRDWWTPADLTEFQKRTRKLIEQYSRYEPLPGHPVNGELTLGENIGDLGGVTIAYKAYQLARKGEKGPLLDGLTADQRFFLGYAQVWPTKYTDLEIKHRLLVDPHSPAAYRVNGVVSNIPAFYEAFGVHEGDPMYLPPEERVKIW